MGRLESSIMMDKYRKALKKTLTEAITLWFFDRNRFKKNKKNRYTSYAFCLPKLDGFTKTKIASQHRKIDNYRF